MQNSNMLKIVALMDSSNHHKDILYVLQKLAISNPLDIKLLQVLEKHYDTMGQNDLSGMIGMSARSQLLKELSEKDTEQASLKIEKARSFLDDAKEYLQQYGIKNIKIELRHGSLLQALGDRLSDCDMVIMAKRGEEHGENQLHLGQNFEEIVQNCKKPLLIASDFKETAPTAIDNICIAYDSSIHADSIIDTLVKTDIFKKSKIHCLMVGEDLKENHDKLSAAVEKLSNAHYAATYQIDVGDTTNTILKTIKAQQSQLLIMGAYGHSRLRRFLIGSTTHALIKQSPIPTLIIK